jgi:hypothetical protein
VCLPERRREWEEKRKRRIRKRRNRKRRNEKEEERGTEIGNAEMNGVSVCWYRSEWRSAGVEEWSGGAGYCL